MSDVRIGLSRLGRLRRRRSYGGISVGIRRRLLPGGRATAERSRRERCNKEISRNCKLFLYAHVAVLQREPRREVRRNRQSGSRSQAYDDAIGATLLKRFSTQSKRAKDMP